MSDSKKISGPVRSQAASAIAGKIARWEVCGHGLYLHLLPLIHAFPFKLFPYSPHSHQEAENVLPVTNKTTGVRAAQKAAMGSFRVEIIHQLYACSELRRN